MSPQLYELLLLALRKGISRKFLAWAVATAGLFTGYIPSDTWEIITLLYVGAQSLLDGLKTYKGNHDQRETRGSGAGSPDMQSLPAEPTAV